MSRTTLKIEGMTCGHCVTTVAKALNGLDGVLVEKVAIGSAIVSYDAAVASPEQIVETVSDTGYTAALA